MSRFTLRADESGAMSDRAAFEVLCLRCEVTFASETKRCIHCGEATMRSGGLPFEARSEIFETAQEGSLSLDPSGSPAPDLEGAGSFSGPGRFELESDSGGGNQEVKPGRSILGSMGSLIWIAMVVAFSLSSRMCGE